jgi:hypothetical protein
MDKAKAPQDQYCASDSNYDPSIDIADASATPVRVSRLVCQNEIPISEAVIPEATDYVLSFCGLDFYERWRKSSNTLP